MAKKKKNIILVGFLVLLVLTCILAWLIFSAGCLNNERIRLYGGSVLKIATPISFIAIAIGLIAGGFLAQVIFGIKAYLSFKERFAIVYSQLLV